MWVCSGTHSDSKPRSSSARPSAAGCMESVVKNITAPIFMLVSPFGWQGYRNSRPRRLDRGPQARAERPSLHDKQLIVERRSLRSALRAPVETTEIATCDSSGEAREI